MSNLKPIERKLSKTIHLMLYVFMLGLPISGFLMTSFFGAPTYLFGWEFGPLWEPAEQGVLL